MAEVTLDVEVRNETGKSAGRRLRRSGKVPGVVYGKKVENVDLQMDAGALQKLLQSGGSGGLINLKYDGNKQVVLVKEVQTDPILGWPLHVDFHAVALDEDVQVDIPVTLTGEDERDSDGGIVSQSLRELSVSCLPASIPESIVVDVSGLAVGESITAGQIALPEGVSLAVDADETVLSIILPRVEAEEEEASEGEEGEPQAEEGEAAAEEETE